MTGINDYVTISITKVVNCQTMKMVRMTLEKNKLASALRAFV